MSEYKIFDDDKIDEIVFFLKSGGILCYPSESVWGIGCDAFNANATNRIFELKSRPEYKGLIVLTDDADKLVPLLADLPQDLQIRLLQKIRQSYDDFDIDSANQVITHLIPISATVNLPKALMANFDSLAVRITHHPILKQICAKLTNVDNPFGFLVSTSCNVSGAPSATTLDEAIRYFDDKVAYLNTHGLGLTQPSQIINLMTGQVLR